MSQEPTLSRLEKALMQQPKIVPNCEHEIDILRLVLLRKVGTAAQRNTLLRIIREHKPAKPVTPRLENKILDHVSTPQLSYTS